MNRPYGGIGNKTVATASSCVLTTGDTTNSPLRGATADSRGVQRLVGNKTVAMASSCDAVDFSYIGGDFALDGKENLAKGCAVTFAWAVGGVSLGLGAYSSSFTPAMASEVCAMTSL